MRTQLYIDFSCRNLHPEISQVIQSLLMKFQTYLYRQDQQLDSDCLNVDKIDFPIQRLVIAALEVVQLCIANRRELCATFVQCDGFSSLLNLLEVNKINFINLLITL